MTTIKKDKSGNSGVARTALTLVPPSRVAVSASLKINAGLFLYSFQRLFRGNTSESSSESDSISSLLSEMIISLGADGGVRCLGWYWFWGQPPMSSNQFLKVVPIAARPTYWTSSRCRTSLRGVQCACSGNWL